MQETKPADEKAVKGGFVTAKTKSQLLSAWWLAEVIGIFVEAFRMCSVPGSALAREGEGKPAGAGEGPPAPGRTHIPRGAGSRVMHLRGQGMVLIPTSCFRAAFQGHRANAVGTS